MEIYIVRIGIVKSAYPSLESAQDALNRFLQSNKEYTDYEAFLQDLRQELDKADYKASVELLNNNSYATVQW